MFEVNRYTSPSRAANSMTGANVSPSVLGDRATTTPLVSIPSLTALIVLMRNTAPMKAKTSPMTSMGTAIRQPQPRRIGRPYPPPG